MRKAVLMLVSMLLLGAVLPPPARAAVVSAPASAAEPGRVTVALPLAETRCLRPDVAADSPAPDAAARSLAASARIVRPATTAESTRFHAAALGSPELAAARLRLSPVVIDTSAPRAVGTTVGRVAVYYPLRGAGDGPANQYGLWFDAATATVVGEVEFLRTAAGLRARMVTEGVLVLDGRLTVPDHTDGDFWDCLRWCLGEVADQDVLFVLRAACSKFCSPWPALWCQTCLLGVGVLEAGMISGCTYGCWR